MYYKYLKVRFLSLYRIWCEIGVLRMLFLFAILFFSLAMYVNTAPQYLSSIVVFIIIYFSHTYRKDKKFIQSIFGSKSLIIYWMEYIIYSFFFLVVSIYKGYYPDIPIILGIIVFSPFIFCSRIKIKGLNNPLFMKGGYEHILAFRSNFAILIICYCLCFIGAYKSNITITFVFYMLLGLLYSYALMKCEPALYTVNYINIKNFINVKTKQIAYNHSIIFSPLTIICIIINTDLINKLLLLFFLVAILNYTTFFLKYAVKNSFVNEFIFATLIIP